MRRLPWISVTCIFRAPVPCVQPTRAEKQAATLKDPATEGLSIQWEDGVMGTAPTRLEPLLSLDIFICCFCFKSMSFSPRRLDAISMHIRHGDEAGNG